MALPPLDPAQVIIRLEVPSDVDVIREIVTAAFVSPAEGQLIDELRASGNATLSLVAELEGRVVGHVMFSPMRIEPPVINAVGLGPLAVQPALHGRGIGSRLVRVGIAECRRRSVDAIFLVGAPGYYSRFGFELCAGRNVTSDQPPGYFQFIEMWEGAVGSVPLTVRFAPEFDRFT